MNTNIALASPLNSHAARKLNTATWKAEVMNILIRAEGIDLTDELREAVNQKIGRVRQYAPRALRARVHLHKVHANASPNQFRARVHCELPGNDLVAEHTAHDPVAALDLLAEKIERRLRKRKTARLARRVRDHRPNSGRWGASAFAHAVALTEAVISLSEKTEDDAVKRRAQTRRKLYESVIS